MSLNVEQPMQVDVNKNSINNAFTVQGDHIFAVQGDHIGRKIKITFLSKGEIVNLTGCTAIVKCSANGQIIAVNNCDIMDNVVTVELTKTILAYAGKTKLQVSVTDDSGAVISTPIFYLIVSQSISTEPVEKTADFSVLADLTGRIMAVLNDPAVGDTEVKDARGSHTLLGDRLNSIDAYAAFPNHTYNLIKNHINFSNATGWNTINSGTLTASGTLLTAVSDSNLGIYADLEKSVPLNANASVLIKIRARCTSGNTATIKPCWRTGSSGVVIDKSYIAAGNVSTADMTWSVGSTFSDLWLIAKDGTAQAMIDRVGLQISTGATVEIGHFEVYYSQDEGSTSGELEDLRADVDTLTTTVTQNTDIISTNASKIADLQAYVGYTADDILGLQVDFENKRFTRLAGASGLTPGRDFDRFEMFGGRKRCNVLDDGTITAYFGDENYAEDGSNGQVMVYQPAFYYKVVPVAYEKNKASGTGYHLRKVNYYISARAHNGFKLHPAFFDSNGNEIDYILYSAYEGCLYSNHHYVDDNAETSAEIDVTTDLICSLAGRKPISGLYKPMTRSNLEALCQNHGTCWHLETIKSVAANQLLMIVEYATMNLQSVVGQGIVSIPDNDSYNCSSLTGATASLGNLTGEAAETVNEVNGTKTTYTTSGKTAVSYRGIENPWGNMWRFVNGINVYGDGTMSGGQAYICDDLSFAEGNADNYKKSGFTLPPSSGFISAMGYGGDDYDWLMSASEIGGTSVQPVGDYIWVAGNLNGYRACRFGGNWRNSANAGPFCCYYNVSIDYHSREYGGRLLYVPTAVN
ncbi:MAG: BppU family phage baseplate upper protein [Acutalibacteraceae bacterium]